MSFSYPYATGPDAYVDEISANGGTIFLQDQSSIGRAVCYAHANYRTIFSPVIFGALGSADDRAELMGAYADYLLTGAALGENGRSRVRPLLSVSPNPLARGGAVRVTAGADGTVAVFDAFGREVASWQGRDATWRPEGLNAGTYFLRLTAQGRTETQPLVICR